MATWKKVVVSGSSAELAALKVDNLTSGSVVIGGGTVGNLFTTPINGTGNIVATTAASGLSHSGSFSGSFTGNITGTITTASYAIFAVSSSYAFTASSAVSSSVAISSSFASTASFVPTSSLVGNFFAQNGNSFGTTATLGTNDAQNLAFETNGLTRAFISSSGVVAINTSSVSPNTRFQVGLASNENARFGSWEINTFDVNSAMIGENVYFDGGFYRYRNNGYATILVANTGIGFQVRVAQSGTAGNVVSYIEPFTLSPDGNLGLGTTSPTARLDVVGNALVTGSLSVTQGITGSLFGTASWATNFLTSSVTSASYAFTASSAVSAFTASSAVNSRNALTASSADNFVVRQSITASSALINGTLTAQTLVVTTVSSSVVYSSGSNVFGNSTANTQTFTGSVNVTGSMTVVGRATISDLTGSLFGTASWAQNFITSSVTSASYAFTASSATNAFQAISASYAFTASSATAANTANSATSASYAFTASSAVSAFTASSAVSASYALTASFALNVPATASFALTASLAVSASNFAVTDTTTGTGPYYLTFVDGTSGFRTPRVDSVALTFNATTNFLNVTASNAFTASSAVSSSWAGNAGQVNNSLTFGNGLSGATYNGSAAITAAVGAGALITVDADSVMVTTSSLSTNQIPKYSANALAGSNISDTGTQVQIAAGASSGLSVAAGGVNVTGNSTFNNNVVVSGDLTVAGTASFQNSQNLLVRDQFILLASGSTTLVDGGIIVANGGLSGSAMYLEVASSGNYGRWAVASELNASASTATADEYVVTAKINQASNPSAAPTWGSTTNGSGNLWITNAGDIFIYA